MEDKKTDESVKTALEIEGDAAPGLGLSPDPEIPTTATEKDEDELVHEKTVIETETVLVTETDLDDVVHEQPPVPPPMDGEKDIDDLMHPRI